MNLSGLWQAWCGRQTEVFADKDGNRLRSLPASGSTHRRIILARSVGNRTDSTRVGHLPCNHGGTAAPSEKWPRPLLCPPARLGPFFRQPSRVGKRAMAIYRWLANTPLAETGHLIAAYELTLLALDLVDRSDPLTEMIADKVIEIGATGLKDPAEISKRVMKLLTFN